MTGTPDHPCFCIPITCASEGCPRWCLIELQGELEVQEDNAATTYPVGTLCQSSFVSSLGRSSVHSKPTAQLDLSHTTCMQKGDALSLTVGNHQLEGKKVALKKPFAILDPDGIETKGLCQSYKVWPGWQHNVCWELFNTSTTALPVLQVIGMLHDKYLFKTRPRPLISKPDPSRQR